MSEPAVHPKRFCKHHPHIVVHVDEVKLVDGKTVERIWCPTCETPPKDAR